MVPSREGCRGRVSGRQQTRQVVVTTGRFNQLSIEEVAVMPCAWYSVGVVGM